MIRFGDILEQGAPQELLRRMATRDRLPHALLFQGPRGVGKTSTAFALAAFINCNDRNETEACGICNSCRKFGGLAHPDLHWIIPIETGIKKDKRATHVMKLLKERTKPGIARLEYAQAATIAIGRDDDTRISSVAELRTEAGKGTVEAQTKVFVVSEAERMRAPAANSLLKVLEEPNPGNLIILTTSQPKALLETIRSRCQSLRFHALNQQTVETLLLKRADADPKAVRLAAALARGSLTKAAALVEEDVVLARDQAVELFGLAPGDSLAYKAVADLAGARDRTRVRRLFDFGLLWCGDLLRLMSGSDLAPANWDRQDDLEAQAQSVCLADLKRWERAFFEARVALEGNGYLPLLLQDLLNRLAGETPVPLGPRS